MWLRLYFTPKEVHTSYPAPTHFDSICLFVCFCHVDVPFWTTLSNTSMGENTGFLSYVRSTSIPAIFILESLPWGIFRHSHVQFCSSLIPFRFFFSLYCKLRLVNSPVIGPSTCKHKKKHLIINLLLACVKMNSIYYDVLKFN